MSLSSFVFVIVLLLARRYLLEPGSRKAQKKFLNLDLDVLVWRRPLNYPLYPPHSMSTQLLTAFNYLNSNRLHSVLSCWWQFPCLPLQTRIFVIRQFQNCKLVQNGRLFSGLKKVSLERRSWKTDICHPQSELQATAV